MIDSEFHGTDVDLLLQDITPSQAETFLGGYCQPDEDYHCVYIVNITKNPSQPKIQPKSTEVGTIITGQKINTIDNSRKNYINGVPIKGERNIVTICS
ncbi:hypothetical protein I8748_20845 [Nostoc sp. CENA67]|uniref:Uncharacterized protein n=1 Tax=Amazonocrinis nigriterrae CENA67 TaxID=2794033 RepID=A0A8J7LAW2_9NOST|nr:hypothetical protein [Amazonocrinis nigriterrae]MBH8564601.1 hypothetical protein [Amazonocrinis nigriterrae CENA67]